jgi:undecaprenyl-phosphate 4-deoxy-4-formamido-L-arabinose transferase
MKSNSEQTSVSIVIPVYNAEETIANLVEELISELGVEYALEIVLVNDRSRDTSERVCITLFKKYPSVIRFFSLAKNVGEHNAVMAGLNNISGDFAVIMDDDFQNPIQEVKRLIDYTIQTEYDVVYTYYEKKEHSLFRNLGSLFNDRVANLMLGKPRDLYLSSFKIIRKTLVDEIIKYDLPFPYIDGLVLRSTENIGKFKVKHDARKTGKSGYTLSKLVSLWLNMFINFSILPLRLATFMGFAFAGVGFLLGISAIIERVLNPNLPQGYTFLFVFIAVISGVQLISVGILGEYIGRFFLSHNKQPQYIIKSAYRDLDDREKVANGTSKEIKSAQRS